MNAAKKSKTQEEINKSAQITRMLFADVSDFKVESLDSDKETCHGIYSNGIWEKRITPIGEFIRLHTEVAMPALTVDMSPSFSMKLPKIPVSYINAISDFFKVIMKTMSMAEAIVQIFWDKDNESYKLHVPEQKVSGAYLEFDHSLDLLSDDSLSWVMDIHSHNSMGAFFSGGDDRDEQSTRLFGVMGRLNTSDIEMKFRAGFNGHFINISAEDIIDLSDDSPMTIPDEMRSRVKPLVRNIVAKNAKPAYINSNPYGAYDTRVSPLGLYGSSSDFEPGVYSRYSTIDNRALPANSGREKFLEMAGGLNLFLSQDEVKRLDILADSVVSNLEDMFEGEFYNEDASHEADACAKSILEFFLEFKSLPEKAVLDGFLCAMEGLFDEEVFGSKIRSVAEDIYGKNYSGGL